ncbi:hypothetical protein E2C01_027883 [Portunus trituberculatus]|uniref:Uncharacterized protein n=1 Tax=Portunus trituberculatus TaxID=210409 RepID=A0A5B7EJA5_PORTR|nr:hypothetical protein [Portunus trituberculatus]
MIHDTGDGDDEEENGDGKDEIRVIDGILGVLENCEAAARKCFRIRAHHSSNHPTYISNHITSLHTLQSYYFTFLPLIHNLHEPTLAFLLDEDRWLMTVREASTRETRGTDDQPQTPQTN